MKNLFWIIFLLLLPLSFKASANPQDKLTQFLFDSKKSGVNTEAFILKGPNIYSKRFDVGSEATKHLLWSMSKTISALIFGILEDRGIVNRDDSIYKYLKNEIDAIGGDRAKKLKTIKLEHLLSMSSGLDWNEYYEGDPFNSDIVRLLYIEIPRGGVPYILNRDVAHTPGTRFYYSSGDTHLLMGALQKAVSSERKEDYPWHYLFNPMGIDAIFERDKDGVFAGSSYLYLTTGDLMKVAELILQNGEFAGKKLISNNYMQFFKRAAAVNSKSCDDENNTYGASVWLNKPCPLSNKKPYPKLPDNIIMLRGHGGQSIVIFPDLKAYAVRIAKDKPFSFKFENYLLLVSEVLSEN